MSATEDMQKLEDCLAEVEKVQGELDTARAVANDAALSEAASQSCLGTKFEKRACGVMPDSKVSAISWYPGDTEHLVTVLQDGKIIIHSAKVGKSSMRMFLSQNTWLMTAEFSPDSTKLAVGGLDNILSIHNIPDLSGEFEACPTTKPWKTLEKHAGYINTCQWLANDQVLTGSGDRSVMLWDLNTDLGCVKEPKRTFNGHAMDAAALSTWEGETNLFVTGSSDKYAKLWDLRVHSADHNGCVATFAGHESAISSIKKIASCEAFVTGSEDGTVRMWDMRCQQQLQVYGDEDERPVTALDVTKSGRLIFVGYNKGTVKCWDSLTGGMEGDELNHHTAEVSAVVLSRDGMCVATGARSEENNFALWA